MHGRLSIYSGSNYSDDVGPSMKPKTERRVCGRSAPDWWLPSGLTCVLPLGHEIKVRLTPRLKKRNVISGHKTSDGRKWPQGQSNLEWE